MPKRPTMPAGTPIAVPQAGAVYTATNLANARPNLGRRFSESSRSMVGTGGNPIFVPQAGTAYPPKAQLSSDSGNTTARPEPDKAEAAPTQTMQAAAFPSPAPRKASTDSRCTPVLATGRSASNTWDSVTPRTASGRRHSLHALNPTPSTPTKVAESSSSSEKPTLTERTDPINLPAIKFSPIDLPPVAANQWDARDYNSNDAPFVDMYPYEALMPVIERADGSVHKEEVRSYEVEVDAPVGDNVTESEQTQIYNAVYSVLIDQETAPLDEGEERVAASHFSWGHTQVVDDNTFSSMYCGMSCFGTKAPSTRFLSLIPFYSKTASRRFVSKMAVQANAAYSQHPIRLFTIK